MTTQINQIITKIKEAESFTLLYNLHIEYYGNIWKDGRTVYSPNSFIKIYCRLIDNKPFWCVNQKNLKNNIGKNSFPYILSKDLLKKKIPGEPDYKGTFDENIILDYCKHILEKYNLNAYFLNYDDALKISKQKTQEAAYRQESKIINEKIEEADKYIAEYKKNIINLTEKLAEFNKIKKQYEQRKSVLIKSGNYYEKII